MGLNCPNISRIFHWGSPGEISKHMNKRQAGQEDMEIQQKYTFYGHNRYIDEDMKEYCSNQDNLLTEVYFQAF